MSSKETINLNPRQLPYIEAVTINNVSEDMARATTLEIDTQYSNANSEDPIFARVMHATSDMYIDAFGIIGRTTGDFQTYVYDKHPILDYIKGVASARAMLAAQYQANGAQLPKISPAAETAFMQKQSDDTSSTNRLQNLPVLIRNRLTATGCGEDVLDALTDKSVSLIEQVGALWALSLYVEQTTIPEVIATDVHL